MEKLVIAILNYGTSEVDIKTINVQTVDGLVMLEKVEDKLEELGYKLSEIDFMFNSPGKITLNIKA